MEILGLDDLKSNKDEFLVFQQIILESRKSAGPS